MDGAVYNTWNRLKSFSQNGTNIYHCSGTNEVRYINALVNAGYITVTWKTALDAVFYIVGETK